MTALTDYLLAKHAASLTQKEFEPLCFECPGAASIRDAAKWCGNRIVKAYKAVCGYFERTAREHNQMKNAPENWNKPGGGVYVRGLM